VLKRRKHVRGTFQCEPPHVDRETGRTRLSIDRELGSFGVGGRRQGFLARDPRIEAVELSAPVSQKLLDNMRWIGFKTIIRYYDMTMNPARKTLRRAERDLILANGFKTAVVFQHHNDQFASFTGGGKARMPSVDRARQGRLSTESSAIYFGVDGPWKELTGIIALLHGSLRETSCEPLPASASMARGSFCDALLTSVMLTCWLAAPTRWPATTPITRREDGDWRSSPHKLRRSQCRLQSGQRDCTPITASSGIEASTNPHVGRSDIAACLVTHMLPRDQR